MLATAIIVFREVLEAALIVGIVLAAARGVPRRAAVATMPAAGTANVPAVMTILVVATSLPALTQQAEAGELKTRYPNIEYREIEIEQNNLTTFDKRQDKDHNSVFATEIGVGALPFWFVEFEVEAVKVPGEQAGWEALSLANYFMLTEPGKYWLDAALFMQYEWTRKRGEADEVKLGALLQKEFGKTLHTLNLYWEKQVGPNAEPIDTVQYSWQSRYRLHPMFQPGVELFGEIEDVSKPGRFNEQQFRIGPMFAGSVSLSEHGGAGKIKYEAGYLFGATSATEQRTLRTRLEYEIGF